MHHVTTIGRVPTYTVITRDPQRARAHIGRRDRGQSGIPSRAGRLGANVVIYGNLAPGQGTSDFSPEFYITKLPDGHVLLDCLGSPNYLNTIQTTPDLITSWTKLDSVLADPTGFFQYEDADPGARKFYRLSLP